MFGALAVSELCFGGLLVELRELSGNDVLAIDADDTRAALRLLERLFEPGADPRELTAPERDRVLAEVYVRNYGDRIQSEPRCGKCGVKFDVDFRLSELVESTWPTAPPRRLDIDEVRYLRVPNGGDELAVRGLPGSGALEALAARCTRARTSDSPSSSPIPVAEMSTLLEQTAPVLDLELGAGCPECLAHNDLGFRIQSYLLQRLLAERRQLPRQLDRLARAYGWSATEILSLPRTTRMELVELAGDDATGRAG
jgi:hypothetical protein